MSRARRIAAAGAALLALAGCSEMPLREGPRARLMPGIHAPRDRDALNMVIVSAPVTGWSECLARMKSWRAALSVATVTVYHACAKIPPDRRVPAGKRAWCVIVHPDGDIAALEHEIRHCEGWDHPRPVAKRGTPDE